MIKSKKKTMKTLMFSIGLAALLVASNNLNAQNDGSRGLFGLGKSSADYDYSGNRDDESGVTIGNMQNDNPTPLGSGLLIMLGAGVGYVALKKNKED